MTLWHRGSNRSRSSRSSSPWVTRTIAHSDCDSLNLCLSPHHKDAAKLMHYRWFNTDLSAMLLGFKVSLYSISLHFWYLDSNLMDFTSGLDAGPFNVCSSLQQRLRELGPPRPAAHGP